MILMAVEKLVVASNFGVDVLLSNTCELDKAEDLAWIGSWIEETTINNWVDIGKEIL
jgi:hypothetical protein